MKLLMELRTCSYLSIAGITLTFSACRASEAKENVMASAFITDPMATHDVAAAATTFILQSTDGGLTWHWHALDIMSRL